MNSDKQFEQPTQSSTNTPSLQSEIPVLGVDFGGVIAEGSDKDSDTSFFGDNFLSTPATVGSFAALAALNSEGPYAGNVHIVSKAGPVIQEKTLKWLEYHRFHEKTGIPVEHVHFTSTREGKGPVAKALGLTAFIDDKSEILEYVAPTVRDLYLFNPDGGELNPENDILERATIIHDWKELEDILIRHAS